MRFLERDWEGAGKFLDDVVRNGGGGYNATILLMRSRCFQQRGQWADTVRTAGEMVRCSGRAACGGGVYVCLCVRAGECADVRG